MPLTKDTPVSTWIHDFVHSVNPKFAGKSKAKRVQMALAAHRSAMSEGIETPRQVGPAGTPPKGSYAYDKGGYKTLSKDEVKVHKMGEVRLPPRNDPEAKHQFALITHKDRHYIAHTKDGGETFNISHHSTQGKSLGYVRSKGGAYGIKEEAELPIEISFKLPDWNRDQVDAISLGMSYTSR